ncbi:DHA2 family efflux MFS transporter permease subunit [Burkholderia plantarii]|uniref:Putative drug resistance transporter, EmrB/QacA subfamily n=1 Tax=Burkholderia plantarii TaxID=41899 RepID=A0A0B6S1X9_BURPL|nr:DHA2 family efflux MFS transporter permease subunit [Burkholderia plantarii]AJK48364.1 putative drug resistance transporter, EmrB/QacA subfamily [Burkholderia plantarii]
MPDRPRDGRGLPGAGANAAAPARAAGHEGNAGAAGHAPAPLTSAPADATQAAAQAAKASPGRLDRSVWKIAGVATLGSLLAQLDATIVNVSLSSLATALHCSLSTIQWVTSGYLLALTLALPLNGWLVDRIGAKRVYLLCFAAFTLSSALCGLAWSAGSLIGFRVLQGISGGLLAPMAQMTIARAAGAQMARVVGYSAVPVLFAPILGPVLAGALVDYASWRWLFLMNLPIGALGLALALRVLPADPPAAGRRRLDWIGFAQLSPALVLLLFGCERIGQAAGLAAAAAGAALLAWFVHRARRRADAALLDLALFRRPVFALATAIQFVWNGALFVGQMLVPLYLIEDIGRTPAEMGWLLAPTGLGMLVTYPSMGALTARFGLRRVSAAGSLLACVATLPMVWLALHGFDLGVLLVTQFLRGMGQSAIGVPTISSAYASVPRASLPMATTALNIVQRLGGPVLTTLCTTLVAWRLAVPAAAGANQGGAFAWGFAMLAALYALTFLGATRLPHRIEHAGGATGTTARG